MNLIWDETEGSSFKVKNPSTAVILFSLWDADEETDNEDFIAGDVDTGFIPKHADELTEPPVLPEKDNKVIKAAKRAAKRAAKSKALA